MTAGHIWAQVLLYNRFGDWRNWVIPAVFGGVILAMVGASMLWDATHPRPVRRPVRRADSDAPSNAATFGCCFALYLAFLAFVGALYLFSRAQ